MGWRCIILMGQANSESIESRQQLAKKWLPSERDPNVLINRMTDEQLQRHYIRILVKDLPRETALFSTRMASPQPHICRLLYFHPATPDQRNTHDHEKDFRDMYIYTDRILPIRTWRRDRVLIALQGLRRLIGIHGPIKITERMICENEVGEVKVWISENPVNNHPDSKYMSEEQSMGDFAAILTRKNQELANLLMGCITLKEANERLCRQREEHSPYQNYSHRASGSGDFKRRLDPRDKNQNQITPYKNVFGELPDSVIMKQQTITPKNTKMHEKCPQSSFVPNKEMDKSKPTSQISALSKYREFIIPSKLLMDDKIGTKSNPKLNLNECSIEYRKKQEHPDPKSNYKSTKNNDNSFDYHTKKNGEYLSFTGSNARQPQPSKPINFQHRFETATNLSNPAYNYASPKRTEPNWNIKNEINYFPSQNECPKDPPKWQNSFKEERIKSGAGGGDITIINNNVNNFISNITHNHIVKEEIASPPHQFKIFAKGSEQNNTTQTSSQFMKNPQKTKEKQYNIPIFLQQKKKTSTQWAEELAQINQKLKHNNISRKNTVSSNPSYDPPIQFSSEKNLDNMNSPPSRGSAEEKPQQQQKGFNLSRNNECSVSSTKVAPFNFNNLYPLTPTPVVSSGLGFGSSQKDRNSFEHKIPLRTKTMEFYQKGKGGPKNEELQNKSFTQADFEKNSHQSRVYEKKEVSISAHTEAKTQNIVELIKSSQIEESEKEEKPVEKKLQFKKQLRNQFKNLLGGDNKEKPEETITTLQLNSNEDKPGKEVKEVNLKEKIKQKQSVFAELKKEALRVLTDI